MARIIIGISGASGIVLGYRALSALTLLEHDVELVVTRDASLTALEELGPDFSTPEKWLAALTDAQRSRVRVHKIQDFSAPIASGSYPVDGMMIIPCSMATLAAIACGLADSLLRRSADVTLKERRTLVIVPREAPLSEIHLENMLRLTRMGATIVPPIPAWYTHPRSLEDIENFIVGRCLDALRISNNLYPRWKSN